MPLSHRTHRTKLALAAPAAALILALAPSAFAQSPDDIKNGRKIAGEGLEAYNASKFDDARKLFEKARALYPSAQVLRLLGYSELALEHWIKAAEAMEAAIESKIGPLSKEDKKDVEDNLAKALTHVGTITVVCKTPKATIQIDDMDAISGSIDKPMRLVEGQHKIVIKAPEHLDEAQDIKIEPGKKLDLTITLKEKPKPPPPKPPPPKPKAPPVKTQWFPNQKAVGLGLAGAGVGLGAAALGTMIQWISLKSAVDKDAAAWSSAGCPNVNPQACEFNRQAINIDAGRADRFRNISLGLGVGAGVLFATGAAFLLAPKPIWYKPPKDTTTAASLGCAPLGAGIACEGSF